MKLFVVALTCLVALAAAEEDILRFYHENVGINLAERIKQSEKALDFDGARIVGGSQASLGNYPHVGGLIIDLNGGQQSVCGSSLLSNTKSVTAAHCWFDGRNQAVRFTVVLGSVQLFSGGTRITTSNVQMHGSYNTRNLNNDVAIITFNRINNLGNNIAAINLPSGSLLNNNFAGTFAQAAGFGKTSDSSGVSSSLRHATLQVINNSACQNRYLSGVVISSTLCTNNDGRSTCGGDSGGPLSITSGGSRVLIGITSFGAQAGCLAAPAGFARVTSFASWIRARL